MAQYTPEEVERITYLALIQSPATANEDDAHAWAMDRLADMRADDLLPERGGSGNSQSSGRSERSGRQGSSSRSGSRGRDRARQGNGGGQGMRDPDGPPTDKQVAALLKHSNDYTEDEAWELTKQEVSDILDDLFSD